MVKNAVLCYQFYSAFNIVQTSKPVNMKSYTTLLIVGFIVAATASPFFLSKPVLRRVVGLRHYLPVVHKHTVVHRYPTVLHHYPTVHVKNVVHPVPVAVHHPTVVLPQPVVVEKPVVVTQVGGSHVVAANPGAVHIVKQNPTLVNV